MQQLICTATDHIELCDVPMPTIESGELLIQMRLCGICGTDLMKIHDDTIAKPAHIGHEVVGTVAQVGEGVTNFQIGQRVALTHHVPNYASHFSRRGSESMDPQYQRTTLDPGGFAEYIRLSALHVEQSVVAIPDDMPDERAVFVEPLCCVLRSLDRVQIMAGDTIAVVGVGAVGMLFIPLLRDRSATVLALDVRQERLDLAQSWGAAAGLMSNDPLDNVVGAIKGASQQRGADLVILTVLNRATLALAMAAIRPGGTILLFGVKPGAELPVDMWKLWRYETNLITSYAATPDSVPKAVAILSRPEYKLEELISHRFPLSDAKPGFRLMAQGEASKVVITNS